MGKIESAYITLVILTFSMSVEAQEIITSFGVNVTSYTPNVISSEVAIPTIEFFGSGNKYGNFELTGSPQDNARSFSLNWESVLNYKRNQFSAHFGGGVYTYSYDYDLNLKDTLSTSDYVGLGYTDQDVWNRYNADSSGVYRYAVASGNVMQLNFGGGYNRSILSYRGFEFLLLGQFNFTFRVPSSIDFEVYSNPDFLIRSPIGGAIKRLNMFLSPGVSIRKNANILTFNSVFSTINVNRTGGLSTFKETGLSFTYSRIIGINKLAKDQYITDTDFALPETRSKTYRKKDKSIYVQTLFGTSNFQYFTFSAADTIRGVDYELGEVDYIAEGYKISMSTPNTFSFNKFFTDRWMSGFQFGTFREIRSSYGSMQDTMGNFIQNYDLVKGREFKVNDLPQSARSVTSATFGFTNAVYLSKHMLRIDPFVQLTVKGVLRPRYDMFESQKEVLTNRKENYGLMTIGGGADMRFKLRSSRYVMVSGVLEYTMHPENPFLNVGFRVGYYKKKKFKMKEY